MIKMIGLIIISVSFLLVLLLFIVSMAISKLIEWISDDEVMGLFTTIVFLNVLLTVAIIYIFTDKGLLSL